MKNRFLALMVIAGLSLSAQQPAPTPSAPAQERFVLPVVLKTYLNTKKAKVGDLVKLELSRDVRGANKEILIPRKAKLTGRISQVKAKGDTDTFAVISIMVEKAEWKEGSRDLHAFIAAQVRPPEINTDELASSNPKGVGAVGLNDSVSTGIYEGLSAHTGELQAGRPDDFRMFRGAVSSGGQATRIDGLYLRRSQDAAAVSELFSKKNFELLVGTTFLALHYTGQLPSDDVAPAAPRKN